jgi:membrane peptidoglycan carboxypeptidase
MAEMARNVSKSMSRQLSSVMSRVGHTMESRPRMDPNGRGPVPRIYSNLSDEETLQLRAQAYRRSRIRLVARKWRLARVRPNPIIYLIGVMTAIVLVVMLSVGGGAGGVYAVSYYQRHVSDIQAIASLRDSQNSEIFDRNGTPIYYDRGNSNFQTYVPLSQISLKLQAATIDTEDHTFYSNDGVDLYGTLRAALADVRAGGHAAQGGSTITQQLVKNIVLNDTTQTIQRKLNEAILAYGVTQQYTKAFILEMYLNTIDYGELNTGIEAAARNFFNLSAYQKPGGQYVTANAQLSWAQAAILAALPNAPTEYQPDVFSCPKAPCQTNQWSNPLEGDPSACGSHIPTFGQDWYTNPQNGHEWLVFCRAELVLYNVYQYGVPGHPEMDLTYSDYVQQVNDVANILVNQQVYSWQNSKNSVTGQSTNLAPHFVEVVVNELADQFGITDPTTAGLNIYTTLDLGLQKEAVTVTQHYIEHSFTETWYPTPGYQNYNLPLSDPSNGNAHNGALVAIDQRNGDILAMVGSVDYNSKDPHVLGYNNITTSPNRKMGSAIKPLMYATAFQMGWTPGVMLQDEPICFPNKVPTTNQPGTSSVASACHGYYVPQDYEQNNYSGTFPLRYQFDGSLNIAATETMSFVGATPATSGNFISMVDRLGVTTIKQNNMGPTTALGDQPLSLLQLTGAYGTLANLGRRAPARAILKITRKDGTVLWQAPDMPQTQQVISAQAAYMVTSVLTDNPARAPFFKVHNPLVLDDDPKYAHIAIAGKTGTSSGTSGPDDIVTAGYTPYMTLGVWVGNTDGNDPLNPGIIGIAGAGYIFHDVMDWAANHYNWDPNATFTIPSQMARGTFNCNTGLAPYQGSTAKDLNCSWNPLTIPGVNISPKGYNTSYDPYDAYGTGVTQKQNTDWYILGDQPITS